MKYNFLIFFCLLPYLLVSQTTGNVSVEVLKKYAEQYLSDTNNVGIAIGFVSPEGTLKYTAGKKSKMSEDSVTQQTLFEIGSITKTFTGILYTFYTQKGLFSPDDFIDSYLSPYVELSNKSRNKIKLWHLVTHSSGLPRLPSDFFKKTSYDSLNPYINYSRNDLYSYMSAFEVQKPGKKSSYSNLGIALLGLIMENVLKSDFERLVLENICKPLQMPNTLITFRNASDSANMAQGYNGGKKVYKWDFNAFEAAGALKSNLNDMTIFLNENISPSNNDTLKKAILKAQERLFKFSKNYDIATCWFIKKYKHRKTIIWHDGSTGGFKSFIGFCPQLNTGVVLMSNSSGTISTLGFTILSDICKLK